MKYHEVKLGGSWWKNLERLKNSYIFFFSIAATNRQQECPQTEAALTCSKTDDQYDHFSQLL